MKSSGYPLTVFISSVLFAFELFAGGQDKDKWTLRERYNVKVLKA